MPGPNYNLLEAVKTLHKDKDTKNARARKTMEIAIGWVMIENFESFKFCKISYYFNSTGAS